MGTDIATAYYRAYYRLTGMIDNGCMTHESDAEYGCLAV